MESALRPQSSARQERHYPAHDPLLPYFYAIFNQSRADPVISLRNSHNSIEEYRDPHSPPLPVEFPVGISENLPESDEEEEVLPDEIHSPTEYGSPFSQIEVGFTSSTDDSESNTTILTTNEQHMTTRPYYFSTPKTAAYLFGLCTTFFLISLKLTAESHVNPFIIISHVTYVMAFLHLLILAWIHKRLNNTNSPHQNLYLGCYRILEIVYYIMCYIAFVSASVAVLLSLHHPQTTSPPSPPPHPHLYPPFPPSPHPHTPPPPPPHPHPHPPPPPHPHLH